MSTANLVAERRPVHWRIVWKKRLATASRWLHIYLSMVSFAVLFFFAVTGLTLNHPDWFGDHTSTVPHKGQVEMKWMQTPETSKLELVEYLRRVDGVKGALSDFRIDDRQCAVSFKGPGYTADAFIDRTNGSYELTETRMGVIAVINDLHKGRDSGKGWSLLIDLSAVLMTLVSLSGFALIFFLQKRLKTGLIAAFVGAAISYAVYAIYVK